MKKIAIKILKVLGVILVLLVIFGAGIYYKSVNYNMYELQADKELLPEPENEEGYSILAEELVAKMDLREKIDQMYGEKMYQIPKLAIGFLMKNRFPHVYVGENKRLHIPPWVLSDGPRGARVMDHKVNSVTTFPVGMARGASWDVDLEERIHEVIAIEMRANKVNYAATPCINLLRHPAWGRAQETYGEDPWLLGEFGVAAVRGIEKHNVMACPKHFALNSLDNSRFVVDVELDERTLREVYLPHFKKTIQVGKPASIMSAYNKVRGEYLANNKYLLNDILRNEWGFKGFVSSDWFKGTYDGIGSVKAGLDVEMPYQQVYKYEILEEGIENGEISEADIDKIVTRTLETRLKYSFSDDQETYGYEEIEKESHVALARVAAEKSMVLIKNDNLLPLASESGQKVLVLGRLANAENTGDHGSSNSTSLNITTPYEGIKSLNESIGNEIELYDGPDTQLAAEKAKQSDQVILVVGYTFENEGEYINMKDDMEKSAEAGRLLGEKGIGGDRESLRLLPEDEALIEAVSSVNKKVVVVYVGGSAINMNAWESKVPSIVFAWYSGMEGGTALANVLYGKVNPSGKLPFSIARNDSDYPYFNPYTLKIEYGYYHGYTLFDKNDIEVAYPFGYGLSYTSYAYNNLTIQNSALTPDDTLKASIEVTNTGDMAGEEIVQLYVGFKNSQIDRPVKLLRGFDKIKLQPGETKVVPFEVKVEDLAWYDPEEKEWKVEEMEYELYMGPSSSADQLLKDEFEVTNFMK
ncbi:beta-glucosidase family protein [Lutimonas zeaxanthinifaciens]|uniref:beta-glucosidase family protein n=1 Tax=Lutimonas zeaxanthinifaciens TaxID=3060215 RepID=UPI00265D1929|nr:glycoside hydrolase family 3 C-terminal domain-containing protein [Lutimonas sp. YSD2104]WKK65348.1 glycoside hydrolase family 3 C-terminal domain-containing protein [Lutimonas sp. YSD2104]